MLKPVDVGKHHVEQDQVWSERIDLLERPISAGRGLDVKSFVSKRHRDELGN